ncbi:hypothetical protein AB9F29_19640 [Falsihalocynthiibacter sp. S25ZX9]|uniref:hypothetical protein n=1 Tax=Falsihalocynthiibacter sp. S25ZX9 TaxID=3240870 RepID=UPI003510B133
MTKKDFYWNFKVTGLIAIATAISLVMWHTQLITNELYPQVVLFIFGLFLLFRVVIPVVFTFFYKFSSEKMKAGTINHPLSMFVIIDWK